MYITGSLASVSPRVRYIVSSSPDRVKPKTMQLVFVASSLSKQHLRERANTGWLGIRIMWPSRATCLSVDCCFSELVLCKSSN